MLIERNGDAARLAGVEALLTDTKRELAQTTSTDCMNARKLCNRLDEMLKELRGPIMSPAHVGE